MMPALEARRVCSGHDGCSAKTRGYDCYYPLHFRRRSCILRIRWRPCRAHTAAAEVARTGLAVDKPSEEDTSRKDCTDVKGSSSHMAAAGRSADAEVTTNAQKEGAGQVHRFRGCEVATQVVGDMPEPAASGAIRMGANIPCAEGLGSTWIRVLEDRLSRMEEADTHRAYSTGSHTVAKWACVLE